MWGLLLYDPEGGINCRNVAPTSEDWAALLSTLPKRCLFNPGGMTVGREGFRLLGKSFPPSWTHVNYLLRK